MLMLRTRRRTMPSPVGAHRHPGRGSPVLSHLATVPSQMPLRRVVSQSERFLDVSQCRTLHRPLEAVYGPYSTSAPCARHSTINRDRARTMTETEQPLSPVSSGPRGLRS